MKFFSKVLVCVSFFALFLLGHEVGAKVVNTTFPTPTPTVAPVSSFELFWPISAGKVEGDSLYFLKKIKEGLREILIFSNIKKAEYNIFLSEKRTVEAEKLLVELKNYDAAKKTLDAAQMAREKVSSLIDSASSKGQNVDDLKGKLVGSLEKQRALLNYLLANLPEDKRMVIEENLGRLNSTLAPFK